MPLTFWSWLLAFSPIIVILILMLALKWGGSKAGAVAWGFSILIAILFFGADIKLILYSQGKALFLALDVLYIIWTALLLYHVAAEAGAVGAIGQTLPRLTADRVMQGLLLGWLFASFLQGMGGFGVPVAVAAPLLVGLGFTPVEAVLMACLGHGWAVNFGSLATSFQTLLAVTGLPGQTLAPWSGILLGLVAAPCGALVAFIAGGWKGLLRSLPAVLILTAVMGGVQYLLVTNNLWTLGATGGAIAGLLVGFLLTRFPLYRGKNQETAKSLPQQSDQPKRSFLVSISGYLILVVLAFSINLIQPLNNFLSRVSFSLPFPALATSLGFSTPAENSRRITLFSHPGAILLYASLAAGLIYWRAGYFNPGAFRRITRNVTKSALNSSIGILFMVGMAVIMTHVGMTNLLALGLSESFGAVAYPLISPFLGALGAFITGSNNNSNVLFANLQMQTASLLKLSVPLILGAQTAGGSVGSVMAPAKVIVGCSTVGLGDNESVVMGKILIYGLIPVAFIAFLAFLFSL
jgi:lactate permease